MEKLKNIVLRSFRFPDRTPEELGESPKIDDAFILEAKWFDGAGNLVKKEDFDADGQVNECDEFEFNERGLIVKHTHSMGGEVTETTVIEYNELGLPMVEEKSFAEGGKQFTRYTYNDQGQVTRKSIQDEDGNEEGYESMIWEDGKLTKKEVRDLSLETGEDFEYKYVQKGEEWELAEEFHQETSSGVSYRTVYSSDGYITYDRKGSRFASHKKVLDEKGRVSQSHHATMQRDVSSFYTYSEDGKLIEEKRKVGDHENYNARYFYDAEGEMKMAHVTEASSGTFTDVYIREIPAQES